MFNRDEMMQTNPELSTNDVMDAAVLRTLRAENAHLRRLLSVHGAATLQMAEELAMHPAQESASSSAVDSPAGATEAVASHDFPALRIAIITPELQTRRDVAGCVRALGHKPAQFARPADLMPFLARHVYFDHIVFACRGSEREAMDQLNAVWESVGLVPTLFLAQKAQFAGIGSDAAWHSRNVVAHIAADTDGITAALIRIGIRRRVRPSLSKYAFGIYSFDDRSQTVMFERTVVRLKPLEYELALTLFRSASKVVSREELVAKLWKGLDASTRTLDSHVSRIRGRLQLDGTTGVVIRGVRRQGYLLHYQLPREK